MVHWATPHFSQPQLEQDSALGTSSQLGSDGGFLEPLLGEDVLPQNHSYVDSISFEDRTLQEKEIRSDAGAGYTVEEWAAWDAGAHEYYDVGGAGDNYCYGDGTDFSRWLLLRSKQTGYSRMLPPLAAV